jgi:hypothetical protein
MLKTGNDIVQSHTEIRQSADLKTVARDIVRDAGKVDLNTKPTTPAELAAVPKTITDIVGSYSGGLAGMLLLLSVIFVLDRRDILRRRRGLRRTVPRPRSRPRPPMARRRNRRRDVGSRGAVSTAKRVRRLRIKPRGKQIAPGSPG